MSESTTIEKNILFEQQVKMLFAYSASVVALVLPYALLISLILYKPVPATYLALWFAALVAVVGPRLYIFYGFHREGFRRYSPRQWVRLQIIFTLLFGVVLGSLSLFMVYPLDLTQQSIITMTLMGMSGVSLAVNIAYRPAFVVFLVPMLLPFAVVQLLVNHDSGVMITVAALLYIAVLLNAHRILSNHVQSNIRLTLANQTLIDELQHNNSLLQKSRDVAQQANQAKSEFISEMSHELRTPLNAIMGYSELLDMDDNLTQQQHLDLQHIHAAGGHLLSLINEILDLSRIEAGRVELHFEDVDLEPLLHECIALLREVAAKRNIELSCDYRQNLPRSVFVDQRHLKQVILNVLSNAIKYTYAADTVVLRVLDGQGQFLQLQVIDHGPGIAREKQSQLFQPFNRLGAENSKIQGSGIGLAISQKFIQRMGGDIGVRSEPQQGTMFWLNLPLETLGRVHDDVPRSVRKRDPSALAS